MRCVYVKDLKEKNQFYKLYPIYVIHFIISMTADWRSSELSEEKKKTTTNHKTFWKVHFINHQEKQLLSVLEF